MDVNVAEVIQNAKLLWKTRWNRKKQQQPPTNEINISKQERGNLNDAKNENEAYYEKKNEKAMNVFAACERQIKS